MTDADVLELTTNVKPVYDESEMLGLKFEIALDQEGEALQRLRDAVSDPFPSVEVLMRNLRDLARYRVKAQAVRFALQFAPVVRANMAELTYEDLVKVEQHGLYRVLWATSLVLQHQKLLTMGGSRSTDDWYNLLDDTEFRAIAALLHVGIGGYEAEVTKALHPSVVFDLDK